MRKFGFSRVLAIALVVALGPVSTAAVGEELPAIERLSGTSRHETAAAISQRTHSSGAEVVVLGRSDDFADVLAGAPLAVALDAPLLLTGPHGLAPAANQEIRRLGAREAVLLGGAAALSAAVERDLEKIGVSTIRRLAGEDRFDTARRIAAAVVEQTGATCAYLTRGIAEHHANGWADAVSASAVAALQGRPILLTASRLPGPTADALSEADLSCVTVVGGSAAVPEAVIEDVRGHDVTTSRIGGVTRYDTSRRLADAAIDAGASPETTVLVTGQDFPDALASAPLTASAGGVTLLIDGRNHIGSPESFDWLAGHADDIATVVLVGGTNAIATAVEGAVRSAVGAAPPLPTAPPAGPPGEGLVVAAGGSDANPGTVEAPLATVRKGLETVGQPGQPRTLYLRGGVYRETIKHPRMAAGSPHDRIRVTAYPGERAVIQGLFHLADLRYVTIDHLEFTWDDRDTSHDHMVRFTNGVGWVFEHNNVHSAKSFAALHVTPWDTTAEPDQWVVRHNRVHNTIPSNGTNQDHNLYIGNHHGTGLIERNIIYGAPNGENIKLGGGSDDQGTSNVTVRFNTMYRASSNMLLNGPSSSNRIYRNIMFGARQGQTSKATVMLWAMTGTGNVVQDNFVGDSAQLLAAAGGTPPEKVNQVDAGGNLTGQDPQFANPAGGDFQPRNPAAQGYGHLAP